MTDYPKKRILMYGQWVEVTVLPPKPTPEPSVTAFPTDPRNLTVMDVTAAETGGRRRGKKRKDD
jgi:hypothetical protein